METLLETAKRAARDAGAAIMELYGSGDFESKGDGSPVTLADGRANEILLKRLQATNIPILSEESTSVQLPYPERLWIIDPMDGTTGFIKRNGEFAVMIGLIEKGVSVLSVLYMPVTDTLFFAEKGKGAFEEREGSVEKLLLNPEPQSPLRFVRSKNHFTPFMESVAQTLGAVMIPQGGLGLKATLLAQNGGDFFFSMGALGEWDVCGPQVIFEEAGGIVTDAGGDALAYGSVDHRIKNGVIFSHPLCHTAVMDAVKNTL